MSEIKQAGNKFYIGESPDHPKAEIVYSSGNGGLIIEHTFVSDELRGEGIGKKLVDSAVEYARKENVKIDSRCPFAKSILENDEKYSDITQ